MYNPLSNKHVVRGVNLLLVIAIIVMVNLVAGNAFFKIDLTRNDAYSLSPVSRDVLARLEDPLRVKVYYTPDLPAPYNGVRQYLTDLLREYDAVEGEHFSWEMIDVSTPEGRAEAQQYGLQQVEIQEIRSDEFQSRTVFMGAVALYGNVVESVDRIASADGLEYRLTTAISSAVTQVDALAGSTEPVVMEVLASPTLADLQIQGFNELEAQMAAIHERVNADNYGRIEFEFRSPETVADIRELSAEYGVRPIRWETQGGQTEEGLLEVVLRQGERTERIPFEIFSQLFGGYTLDDPANIEEAVRRGIRSLVSANPQIAYALGHGEKALQDYQQGAGPLAALVGERYELLPVRLGEQTVPAGIDTLVINGPTEAYSEEALYRIDQFLMNGGSLFVLLDSHIQIIPNRQQQMAGAQPAWVPIETGLPALLADYGVEITDRFVLDEESYIARQAQGSTQLFQAPVLSGESLNADNAITAGLQDVIVLNAAELLPTRTGESQTEDAVRYTALLRSSPQSWTVAPEEIGPWIQGAPASADTGPRDIGVLLEGTFTSHFTEPVELAVPSRDADRGADGTGVTEGTGLPADARGSGDGRALLGDLRTERFLDRGIEKGSIVVLSSSALTTQQLLDPQNRTPNGTLLMNVLDYLTGAPGIAALRSKGLGVPRIAVVNPASVPIARWGNTVLVPAIVIAIGLVVWQRRRLRAHRIRGIFSTEEKGEEV